MTLPQLLPSISELTHVEKRQLMQWLAEQLTEEQDAVPFNTGMKHAVWSPYDSFEAAASLGVFLEQSKKTRQS